MRLSWIVIAALAYSAGRLAAPAPAPVAVTVVVPPPVVVVANPPPARFARGAHLCVAEAMNTIPPCAYTEPGCPCE
jgi:hypothetical protein